MTPDKSTLNERVALALGWVYHTGSHGFTRPGRIAAENLPAFSGDEAYVGYLLLEAQKRGWTVTILNILGQKMWQVSVGDWRADSSSLPKALCESFIAAHDAEKAGVQ